MEINEFISIMHKVKQFKNKLAKEGIQGQVQQTILKVYLQDLTNRINTKILERVV